MWTITIRPATTRPGFYYETEGPRLGMAGYEPTREKLAAIIGKTLLEYLPAEK